MRLPLLFILIAALSASAVAYGTYPLWMRFPHGLEIILWSRRLQWVLVAVSLIGCILLISLTISGNRRAWWLIGLAPVLALFAHRFHAGPSAAGRMIVVENPHFTAGKDVKGIDEDEWVVGVKFGGSYYAYRYATLFSAPVILRTDPGNSKNRMILMWSAFANRVLALPIEHEIKALDLEVVSTPANALLLYDSQRGQFINGLTGQTTDHDTPKGFGSGMPLFTAKMLWRDWLALYPDTVVMDEPGLTVVKEAAKPIQPKWPIPSNPPIDARVAVMGAARPILLDQLTSVPANETVEGIPVAVFHFPDEQIKAFDRRTMNQHVVKLVPVMTEEEHPTASFVDENSGSGWNSSGVCVDAAHDAAFLKNKALTPLGIDDNVSLAVLKYWYPNLPPAIVSPPMPVEAPPPDPVEHGKKKKDKKHKPVKPRPH